MQHKIKITRPQIKQTKVKVAVITHDRPVYTDSDGRVFHEMKPIKYEA